MTRLAQPPRRPDHAPPPRARCLAGCASTAPAPRRCRRSCSCTATATPPRCGRRRCGASSPTAGRATGCTRSTSPTRSPATTTPSRSRAAARPPSTWRTSPPRSKKRARGHRARAGSCWSATRAAATRSATSSPTAAAPRVVSHVVLGGTPNHGVFADATSRLGNEFNGAGPFLTALNAPQGPERRRGHARRRTG